MGLGEENLNDHHNWPSLMLVQNNLNMLWNEFWIRMPLLRLASCHLIKKNVGAIFVPCKRVG